MYQGAAFAALAVDMAPSMSGEIAARTGIAKLREYLKTNYASQNVPNRVWGLLASAYLKDVLTPANRDELVAELRRRQDGDRGWSLDGLGEWRWNKTAGPFQSPGTRDRPLVAKSDGYATGLIVYTLRQAGVSVEHLAVKSGLEWLRTNQLPV